MNELHQSTDEPNPVSWPALKRSFQIGAALAVVVFMFALLAGTLVSVAVVGWRIGTWWVR